MSSHLTRLRAPAVVLAAGLALACADPPTQPRSAIGAVGPRANGEVSPTYVFICKQGGVPGALYTFDVFIAGDSARYEVPAPVGAFTVDVNCVPVYNPGSQATATVKITERLLPGTPLPDIAVTLGASYTIDGATVTLTPAAGKEVHAQYQNRSDVCTDPTASNYTGGLPCTYPPPEVCNDPMASNYGGALPCTYPPPQVCTDPMATNNGGPLPCVYPPPACVVTTSIASNFNGTAIAGGNYIWFNSIFKPTGVPAAGATFGFTGGTVTFTAGGVPYAISVPDATITYSPTATTATTTWNGSRWVTVVPTAYTGNVFFSGTSYQVPAGGLSGGINPVTWSGSFTASAPGAAMSWKWAAAVYHDFASNAGLQVKPVDGGSFSLWSNSDHAGTVENYKTPIGGARGGAGSNFTGSYSGTKSAACP